MTEGEFHHFGPVHQEKTVTIIPVFTEGGTEYLLLGDKKTLRKLDHLIPWVCDYFKSYYVSTQIF